MELSFIIIDDTELDHFIAKKMIDNNNPAIQVKSFADANLALEHIVTTGVVEKAKTVLLVDIYMPLMNGFEFVEAFEKLDARIQEKYYLVALTSSVTVTDINRINSYSSLKTIITKPITADKLATVIDAAFNLQQPG